MPSPFDQSRYQVRLEEGVDGLTRLAPADVVVIVDVLRYSSTMTAAVSRGQTPAVAAVASVNGAPIVVAAAASRPAPLVLLGCLRNASAVARAVLDHQRTRGERTSIAVVAAGERMPRGAGDTGEPPVRPAVEDRFGAGAIVDALAAVGIDHSSPEAAAACEAFRGLRGAVRHLLTAAGSGQELLQRGLRDDVLAAAAIDDLDVVPVLRDGLFVPWA